MGGVLLLTLSTNHETAGTLENRQKNLNGIDLIKFLCSIMVFMVHIPFFTSLNSVPAKFLDFGLRHCICRIAVPFYFVCSGYFLFRKMPLYDPDAEIIKNYCFRILRLIATWLILLIMGGAYHLWYLSATVVTIVMLSLCLHWRVKYRHICILACLLYMIGLLGDSYYGLIAPLRKIKAFNALIQASTSEHASRMNAMQTATTNADEMIARLEIEYNQTRQLQITNEITEIAAATESIKEKAI